MGTNAQKRGAPGRVRMPLTFEHEWTETAAEVQLRVRLGVAPRKGLDVFGARAARGCRRARRARLTAHGPLSVSDVVLKVFAPGYLLLLDLHAAVDDAAARAIVAADHIAITLPKARALCACAARARCARSDFGRRGAAQGACVDSCVPSRVVARLRSTSRRCGDASRRRATRRR